MPTQLEKLQALQKALDDATDNGTFDHLAACSAHPDTINRFCDAVQDAVNDYDADLNPKPTHPFTVIYTEPAQVNWLFFECNAADSDRAEAQLMDAYPTATALWVNTGHGPNSRTQDAERPTNTPWEKALWDRERKLDTEAFEQTKKLLTSDGND